MKQKVNSRLGTVGGQAVLEGVMMKTSHHYAVSARAPTGAIETKVLPFAALSEKCSALSLPILRGAVLFFQMLSLGQTALQISSELALTEEENAPSKFELWLSKALGKNFTAALTGLSCVLGVILSIALFIFLPAAIVTGIESIPQVNLGWAKNLLEGAVRVLLFIGYLLLISKIPDMKRTFEYHGAEHKVVFCYEAGDALTPEHAQEYPRFHPRCGTSFLFVMILIGILFYSLPWFSWSSVWERTLTKLLFFPFIAGLGYEFIRFAGKHPDNRMIQSLSRPGLWMQRITTKEPSRAQLEVAIAAMQAVLSETKSETIIN